MEPLFECEGKWSGTPKRYSSKTPKEGYRTLSGDKYANDISDLCYALRNKELIPRTLLKNGKRSAATFVASRARDSPNRHTDGHGRMQPTASSTQHTPATESTCEHNNSSSNGQASVSHSCSENNRAITTLTRDLGALRQQVTELRSDVLNFKSNNANDTCCLYVRIKSLVDNKLCDSFLTDLLRCPIVCNSIIRGRTGTSLRVRILKLHLHTALTSTAPELDAVRLWQSSRPCASSANLLNSSRVVDASPNPVSDHNITCPSLKFTSWNCRGLRSGEPYIHQLAEGGCDVIAICEHRLWPYEADRLANVHPAFSAEIKTDNRLTEESTLRRGCGGVGLLWKKTLDATPIPSIASDRICGLFIKSLQLSLGYTYHVQTSVQRPTVNTSSSWRE